MPDLAATDLQSVLAATPLFEDKSWQLSPDAWALSPAQAAELSDIGTACLDYHQALESLYLRSAAGKNLLRNRPLFAPWVADYLDRGKPPALIAHARDPRNRGAFPTVLRPDLLLTDEGFVMTELDSVPGGIGLTAFLNRLYSGEIPETQFPKNNEILGSGDTMIRGFYDSLAALRADLRNPLIALVVSEEAATYRPEMRWLAEQLQLQGKRVFCLSPDEVFPLGTTLCFDLEGNPEKIDIVYRFFELFDLANIPTAPYFFAAWAAGEVVIVPPMRPYQEEKLGLALFHHHQLQDYWAEALSSRTLKLLRRLIPPSWVLDSTPLPPGAVLDGPKVGGRALTDWRQLTGASQKERDLIIKISGYHETAWGARSVILGSDCSRDEWQAGIDLALADSPRNPHILQLYKKPCRVKHRVYDREQQVREVEGRLRLCPYYFVKGGKAQLGGALATFCPPDKKIIHGMQDAALLPCRIVQQESTG
ncbi:MAG: hypothetical protein H2172_03020 [Opitutus sp.]|nr:hypothetical protein [Opitutus sp.]MCS6246084.1 hypothetical protein [Opitutus sp.]MCS6274129.1 hypothetical protein [Opitutus sp.]MCS6277793.1 hypothetical protein [Opitutus sp.]MCS6299101.1 hypothetical protein [Opitutus sp.]